MGLSNDIFSPGGAVDMGRMFPLLYTETNTRNLRIFVDEGRPVALSGMTVQDLAMGSVVARAACIGSVCTRDEYRGRGLAARLVEDCMAAAAAQGACLVLVSGHHGGSITGWAASMRGCSPSSACSGPAGCPRFPAR